MDAVVTMQAAHEVRHKRGQLPWLTQAAGLVAPHRLFLFCDHHAEPGSAKNPDLLLTRDEQPLILRKAGFAQVSMLLDEGDMARYHAAKTDQ